MVCDIRFNPGHMWRHTSVSCHITTSTTTSPRLHGHHNHWAHGKCPHRAKPQQVNHFLKGGVWGQVLKCPRIDEVRSHSFLIILGVWGCILKLNITAFRIGFDLNDWFSFRSARTNGRGGIGPRRRGSLNRFVLDHFLVIFDVWGCVQKLTSTNFRTKFYLVDWFNFRPVRSISSFWCPSHLPPHYHCPPRKFVI